MTVIKIPESFPVQSIGHVVGACIDCGEAATTHTLHDNEMAVVHAGAMCDGFRRRFTATEKNPIRTPGIDETGEITDHARKRNAVARRNGGGK